MKTIYVGFILLLLPFLGFASDSPEIKVSVLAKTTSSWDKNLLPSYPKGQPEVTIVKIIIPPKVKLPLHKHPVINAGVVLKGDLTVVRKDNKTIHIKAGEAITEVVNTWHYGKNDTEENIEIIVFYAGIKDQPITIKEPVKQ